MVPDRPAPRVLVVDDDADVRSLMSAVLADDGYDVATAYDGASAVAEVRQSPPDVIVLDLMMPGVSGQEFLRLYQELPGPHAPVIVLSAASRGALQLVDAEGSAAAVVPKPFSVDRLLNLVAATLSRSTRRRRLDNAA